MLATTSIYTRANKNVINTYDANINVSNISSFKLPINMFLYSGLATINYGPLFLHRKIFFSGSRDPVVLT